MKKYVLNLSANMIVMVISFYSEFIYLFIYLLLGIFLFYISNAIPKVPASMLW
jgi:cadmium resistance protein CadD (predicted permease)